MKKIFIFDIDETILCLAIDRNGTREYINKVPADESRYSPTSSRKLEGLCFTLNRDKMQPIISAISENGHLIGFVTSGQYTPEDMEYFFEAEFNITLEKSFPFYSRSTNKVHALKEIAVNYATSHQDIIFIDNDFDNILDAKKKGFIAIQADNNWYDRTHGENYINALNNIICHPDFCAASKASDIEDSPAEEHLWKPCVIS